MGTGKRRPKQRFSTALRALAAALDDLAPARSMLIGGVAAIARGVPRVTRDIDAVVSGPELELPGAIETLRRHAVEPRIDDALAFAAANQVVLLRHRESGVEIDLSLAWLPFEHEALEAAEILELAGTRLPVARAEDLVVYKTLAWRPQDRQDVARLLACNRASIDVERVLRVVRQLAAAIDHPERAAELTAMIPAC